MNDDQTLDRPKRHFATWLLNDGVDLPRRLGQFSSIKSSTYTFVKIALVKKINVDMYTARVINTNPEYQQAFVIFETDDVKEAVSTKKMCIKQLRRRAQKCSALKVAGAAGGPVAYKAEAYCICCFKAIQTCNPEPNHQSAEGRALFDNQKSWKEVTNDPTDP